MSEVLATLERGGPYLGIDARVSKTKLDRYVEQAVATSLLAHRAVYEALKENHPRAIIFDDIHEGKKGKAKFVSLGDAHGNECYDRYEPTHAATDIGIRCWNPEYPGTASTVSIVHANTHAEEFYERRDAPEEVINAVGAVGELNHFAIEEVIKPFLAEVAEECGLSPEEYIKVFYPEDGSWERTVTRIIMYHSDINPSQRPIGSDNKALGGKEHFDQSAWTGKIKESAPGFEWLDKSGLTPLWTPVSDGKVAVFRSAADAYLPVDLPGCAHRGVYDETGAYPTTTEMDKAKISRWAAVTFPTASLKSAIAVRPSSDETHRVS